MSQHHNKLRNLLRKNGIETPENKLIVTVLEAKYPDHGKLAEWLHREVRKGRLECGALQQLRSINAWVREEKRCDKEIARLRKAKEGGIEPWKNEKVRCEEEAKSLSLQLESHEFLQDTVFMCMGAELQPSTLDSLEVLLKKRKQRGEEASIMKFEVADLMDEARAIELEDKARDAGKVLYTFDDGWTIRYIQTGEEMILEGQMLGHCASRYAERVERGESHNYSLRDERGFAHVTLEIRHNRPSTYNVQELMEAIEYIGMEYQCPNCAANGWYGEDYRVVDGRCLTCLYNIEDMEEYFHTKGTEKETRAQRRRKVEHKLQEKMDKIWDERRGKIYEADPDHDNLHDDCPNCANKEPNAHRRVTNVDREDNPLEKPMVECTWCGGLYWRFGHPFHPHHWNLRGGEENNKPRFDGNDWKSRTNSQLAEFMEHDFLEGAAFQIQGKQNISPHSKYHPYIQEWMRSIPYEVRPKAEWSQYYTRTNVLHVDDLELGGPKGEDDFGFRWDNRDYNWDSIIYSLHGHPKRWAVDNTEHVKRFAPEVAQVVEGEDHEYQEELGERLFAFAKEHKMLPQMIEAFERWKENRYRHTQSQLGLIENPYRHMDCIDCGRSGYLHLVDGDKKIQCVACETKRAVSKYKDKIENTVEEIDAEIEYIPYEKAALDHLGNLLEGEKKATFELASYTKITGYKMKPQEPKEIKFKDGINFDINNLRNKMGTYEQWLAPMPRVNINWNIDAGALHIVNEEDNNA